MKIRPVGAELLHADRWTDLTKLNSRFAQLRERTQKELLPFSISNILFIH